MNDIILSNPDDRDRSVPVLPAPREAISIRPAVEGDFPFIDDLQKKHKKAVGFMFAGAIKGHIAKGNVLVAEAAKGPSDPVAKWPSDEGSGTESAAHSATGPLDHSALGKCPSDPVAKWPSDERSETQSAGHSATRPLGHSTTPAAPVGYLIGVDRYLKRDELGIIYQMNVRPEYQRSLVAANLLKAQFERSAYGCRLYCCWCAQDLAANRFWEAMGFVPLAFRTGGGRGRTKKDGKFRGRMHIFWQKRIRQDDDFPYWFPSMTGAGAIGEDRIVLPIPPGTHWSDAKPVVLPEGPSQGEESLLLEAKVSELEKALKRKGPRGKGAGASGPGSSNAAKKPKVKSVQAGGLHFGPVPGAAPEVLSPAEAAANEREAAAKAEADEAAAIELELKAAKKAARKAKKKFDPAQEAFARELKDKWLEQIVAQPGLLAASAARYDVSRQLTEGRFEPGGADAVKRLDAA